MLVIQLRVGLRGPARIQNRARTRSAPVYAANRKPEQLGVCVVTNAGIPGFIAATSTNHPRPAAASWRPVVVVVTSFLLVVVCTNGTCQTCSEVLQ